MSLLQGLLAYAQSLETRTVCHECEKCAVRICELKGKPAQV